MIQKLWQYPQLTGPVDPPVAATAAHFQADQGYPHRNFAMRRQATAALIALAPSFFFVAPAPTRFYLGQSGSPNVSPSASGWDSTDTFIRQRLLRTRLLAGEGTESVTTVLGQFPSRSMRQYVSDPLVEQTISGRIKGQIRCGQSTAETHDRVFISLRVFSGDGLTLRGTLKGLNGYGIINSYSTDPTFTNRKIADGDTLTPVACLAGDRIVLEIGTDSSTVEVGGTVSFKFDDAAPDLPEDETTTSAGAAWIEFSQTLSFASQSQSELLSQAPQIVLVAVRELAACARTYIQNAAMSVRGTHR